MKVKPLRQIVERFARLPVACDCPAEGEWSGGAHRAWCPRLKRLRLLERYQREIGDARAVATQDWQLDPERRRYGWWVYEDGRWIVRHEE